jgi:hypothetical protein
MTGYRTWPALGFDRTFEMSGAEWNDTPNEIKNLAGRPPSLINLTSTREGRQWWRKNGRSVDMQFDLSEGSPSQQRLKEVMARLSKSDDVASNAAETPKLYPTLAALWMSDEVLTAPNMAKPEPEDESEP